jgi:hypothetical protein
MRGPWYTFCTLRDAMMRVGRGLNLTCGVMLAACSWHSRESAPLGMLAVSVADLELHLRDDSYRSFAHLLPDGQNVFEVTRWKIERLQRQRPADPTRWVGDDAVLEFARARTLERLHFYSEAAAAYRRVAGSRSRLAPAAERAAAVMDRFTAESRPLEPELPAEQQLAAIEERLARWNELAQAEVDSGYAALAREETESWEILRVEFFARERSSEEAIEACNRLIEHHRQSKLYPRHVLRLGDLHAEAARREVLHARAVRAPLDETGYDKHLEAALSAYELASEARNTALRREAQSRIQSLLSYHDGVRSDVY